MGILTPRVRLMLVAVAVALVLGSTGTAGASNPSVKGEGGETGPFWDQW